MPQNRLAELDAAKAEQESKREWQLGHVAERQTGIERTRAELLALGPADDADALLKQRTIHRLERELSLWTDAMKDTDARIAATRRELDAEHRRVDRALAEAKEAATGALKAAAYERAKSALLPLEAQLTEVMESVQATVRAWNEVSLRESGNLLGGSDAFNLRLNDAKLDRLRRLLVLVQEVAGTAPLVAPQTPHLSASQRTEREVLPVRFTKDGEAVRVTSDGEVIRRDPQVKRFAFDKS